jgi:tetratricopeptide (TPR) repeat protein
MAKNKKEPMVDESVNLTSTESFIDKYKKPLLMGGGAIVVLILGIVGYQKLVAEPKEEDSKEAYWNAFYEFERDSLELAVKGTADFDGMETVASEYSGTSGGDIANYTLGLAKMQNGEFGAAIEYFDACDFEDVMVGNIVIGLKGDCEVEQGNYEAAAKYFEEAANREKNDYTSPMYLKKAGLAYEKLGQNEKAVNVYQNIKDNYPLSTEGFEIDKYLARATN